MKILDSREFVTMAIDEQETIRFEAFLDRNCPGWREREMFKKKNAGSIKREWRVGVDDVERSAIYRKQYVELCDTTIEADDIEDPMFHFMKQRICDIDGDLTPVAVWAGTDAAR